MKYSLYILALGFFFLPLGAQAATVSLDVPFSPQAPEGVWVQPWQDACEETSIMMIDNFYRDIHSIDAETAKTEILRNYRIKTNHFGYSLDETADTMANWINLFYPWEARVVERPTVEQMQTELLAGRPIILPAHGTELNNPYFLSPLLDYHVFVLIGFDAETQEFIAHDPGTKHGAKIRYSYDTIEAAMHDFEPGNMPRARKVAVFTSPTLTERSAYSDGDGDNMTKAEELLYGTVLWLTDSDGDAFVDGTEMRAGYSPIRTEFSYQEPLVIKSPIRPEVYQVYKGRKMHIPDAFTFLDLGFRWNQIRLVRTDILPYITSVTF